MNAGWPRPKIVLPGLVLFFALVLLGACATTPPPKRTDNLCEIFREHTHWYPDARASYEKWGIPIPVMMAIIYQESAFLADARPPRTTCLWIFPGPRPSSAYGYAQAMNGTWEDYKKATGNRRANRKDFGDAIDFVGWYCALSVRQCGISPTDARNLYLAYHEGRGGFNRKTYQGKAWLLQTAERVERRAATYRGQLAACEGEFQKRGWCLWPF